MTDPDRHVQREVASKALDNEQSHNLDGTRLKSAELLQRAKSTVQDLQKQLDKVDLNLDEIQQQAENLGKRLDQSQEQMVQTQEQMKPLEQRLEQNKSKHLELVNRLPSQEQEVKQLKHNHDQSQARVTQTREQIKPLEQQIEQDHTKHQELTNRLPGQEQEVKQLNHSLDQSQARVAQTREQIKFLENQYKKNLKQQREMASRLQSQESESEHLKKSLDQSQKELNQIHEQITSLEQQREQNQTKYQQLTSRLQSQEQEPEQLKKGLDKSQKDLNQTQEQITSLEQQLERDKAQYQELSNRLKGQEQETKQLRQDFRKCEKSVDAEERDRQRLAAQLWDSARYGNFVEAMELDKNPHENKLQMAERLLDQIEERKSSPLWLASREVRSEFFAKVALRDVKVALEKEDVTVGIQHVQRIADDFAKQGMHSKEVSEITALVQDQKVDKAKLRLVESEKCGLLQINNLEPDGKTKLLSEIDEIKEAWNIAANEKGTSKIYENVRTRFWKLLHPDSNKAKLSETERKIVDVAYRYLKDAGFTFDGVRPGSAPRLVSVHPLSPNDYTLSLQHEIPQDLIRQSDGRLDSLFIDPANLRFATTRNNIHEDTVRFGQDKTFMASLQQIADVSSQTLVGVLKEASAHVDPAQLKRIKEVETQVTKELADVSRLEQAIQKDLDLKPAQTIEELQTQLAIEIHCLDKLRQEQSQYLLGLNNHAGFTKLESQIEAQKLTVGRHFELWQTTTLQAHYKLNGEIQRITGQVRDAIPSGSFLSGEVEKYLDDVRAGRTQLQLELLERLLEMENEMRSS